MSARIKQRSKTGGARKKPRAQPLARAATVGPIRHVVLLMMENRSFDHMLGSLQGTIAEVDGVLTPDGRRRTNTADGVSYPQQPGASGKVNPDPKHEHDNVMEQLKDHNAHFASDYAESYRRTSSEQRQEVMAYHDLDTLPALHELAKQFTICDQWFASVPGPTWPNRLFALSGTSLGRVSMPTGILDWNLHRYPQDTIFDRLREAGRSFRIYFGDFPLALLFEHERRPSAAAHYYDIDQFAVHVRKGEFPDFTFIEPRYLWPGTDDDHPPHDVADGERLIAHVYNTVRSSPLWESTLLVISYDEHGGFYDHCEPGTAIPPDTSNEEYAFDRYGVRVPALLISPWVDACVCHQVFDHTSVLRYLSDLWGLGPLGQRTAGANSIAAMVRTDRPARSETPASIATRALVRALGARPTQLNDLQRAIVSFSQVLEKETKDAPQRRVGRSMSLMQGAPAQSLVAAERARRFLRQRGAKLGTRRGTSRLGGAK